MECAMIEMGGCEGPVRTAFTWAFGSGSPNVHTEWACRHHADGIASWLLREPYWVITYRAETLIH